MINDEVRATVLTVMHCIDARKWKELQEQFAPTDVKRIDKFFGELIWMSKVLRYGRENVSI